MSTAANPCPVCGKPIADTAYVCHLCTLRLADHLLRAAADWSDLEITLSRQDAVDVTASGSGSVVKAYAGPWCAGMCEHESCRQAIDSQCYVALRERREKPLGHEAAAAFHLGAAETMDVVGNTVTTWARHVAETRGVPIPAQPVPLTREPLPVGDGPREGGDEAYCICCDLPVEYCFRRIAR